MGDAPHRAQHPRQVIQHSASAEGVTQQAWFEAERNPLAQLLPESGKESIRGGKSHG
jgi:hypothetical protein